ncbi:uncharacterized protein UV8b_06104 [Ustilaginoidea virens]|uniref:Protein kinase domain-containing protein n=1 Tax=Ustilaginoidea virens TaxID=1159556 RepID=A0A8E5HV36_USTVR|nr:uncharacterized protein UV8b_06104 [Ustilaginoidea virens]QUC21863.1 hypothetical protein UV8b_06104 [Ustilaginoidea virens]
MSADLQEETTSTSQPATTGNARENYKRLFQEAEEKLQEAEERYRKIQQQAEERYRKIQQQAEERYRKTEQLAEEKLQQIQERERYTTFDEFILLCHNLYHLPKVLDSSQLTAGKIPLNNPTKAMTGNAPKDYERLFREAEEKLQQADERLRESRQQAEERLRESQQQAEERHRKSLQQAEERQRQTTFDEFVLQCHNLFHLPKVANISESTTGTIPAPKRKYCPARLVPWVDCPSQLQSVYDSIRRHFRSGDNAAQRVFPSSILLEGFQEEVMAKAISCEQDLLIYDRLTRENRIRDVVSQLCKIPAARQELQLGDGIEFASHASPAETETLTSEASGGLPTITKPLPDVFSISKVNGEDCKVISTCEQKPPHKLSVETIRMGLRPMNLWQEMVKSNKIPTDPTEKMKYDAARLVCSAIVQEYHVMISLGLEYSYLTNGPHADVMLWVPYDDPSTLHFHLAEPSKQGYISVGNTINQPTTSVTGILCLLMMSLRSRPRGNQWRAWARSQLKGWRTSFDYAHRVPPSPDGGQDAELPSSEPDYPSPEASSEYIPSSPLSNPAADKETAARPRTRASCAPSDKENRARDTSPDSSDSDDSDDNQANPARKRGFSSVSASCQSARQPGPPVPEDYEPPEHNARFCSQLCILGLRNNAPLDNDCPNAELHRRSSTQSHHSISADELLQKLKEQLDSNIDAYCTPFADRGGYGMPFKLTLTAYGYTLVGKGTNRRLWGEVSQEAQAYRILQKLQGVAVPVFLGSIDLSITYFDYYLGDIRHMLIMSYGGDEISQDQRGRLKGEIRRSIKEVKNCGVVHQDLRIRNMLWNKESERVVIIDFHRAKLARRPILATQTSKRKAPLQSEVRQAKGIRAS